MLSCLLGSRLLRGRSGLGRSALRGLLSGCLSWSLSLNRSFGLNFRLCFWLCFSWSWGCRRSLNLWLSGCYFRLSLWYFRLSLWDFSLYFRLSLWSLSLFLSVSYRELDLSLALGLSISLRAKDAWLAWLVLVFFALGRSGEFTRALSP